MNRGKLKDFGLITVGILFVAISVAYFFEPNNIAAGGITGLAIVINHYIPFISVGPLVLIMDSVLFVIALIVIGGKFGAKTIYSSVLLSTSMWIMQTFLPFNFTNDLMLATIFGTLIAAAGMAIVFNANASSGGTDIIAKILNKFFHFTPPISLHHYDTNTHKFKNSCVYSAQNSNSLLNAFSPN